MRSQSVCNLADYLKSCGKKSILQTKRPEFYLKKATCFSTYVTMKTEKGLPFEYNNAASKYIDFLYSFTKGAGTRAVKEVLRESINNPETNGRVLLYAEKSSFSKFPLGFYYKLGFRSVDKKYNDKCEIWLKNGGKKQDAPAHRGTLMYLPRENFGKCLNYPNKIDLKQEGLKLLI